MLPAQKTGLRNRNSRNAIDLTALRLGNLKVNISIGEDGADVSPGYNKAEEHVEVKLNGGIGAINVRDL